jgi:transposase InsO family protein
MGYKPRPIRPEDLKMMKLVDDQFMKTPVTHPYIPIRRGFMYLVAIMDWHSRKVLSWRISNTLDSEFCVSALEEAIARY